jgi:hypothetical protein
MNETDQDTSDPTPETDSQRDEHVGDAIGDADATVPTQPLRIDDADRVLGDEPSVGLDGPSDEAAASRAEGTALGESDSAAESVSAAPEPPAVPNEALREELEAAVAALQGEEAPPPRRVKREPPPIPEIPGVPPEQVMKALAAVWKEATDRETPTFKQTLEEGVLRVDVDAVAGYLSVTTEADAHRAIGVRRDMVSPLVAALTARTVRDVDTFLAKGPAKIPSAVKSAQNE